MQLIARSAGWAPPRSSRGVTMLEVLIAIVILAIGMLGLAGMQSRLQAAEFEAYQRAQAIVLMQDMVDRINANRKNASSYVTASPLGTGSSIDCSAPSTMALKDQCEWNDALLGAAESGNVGAMSGGRGCISEPVATMPREIVVAVAWQGITPTVAPGATTCGQNAYGDERTRRAMVARIKVGCLQNDPSTGACVTP